MNISPAPIVLFVYNRPHHTRQTVEALQRNMLADQSLLYIYSDGSRDEESEDAVIAVREYIKKVDGFKKTIIIEREKNYGLAKNIISGVSEIIAEYGKAIVVEDDILTSRYFLEYMNRALEIYEKHKRVMHISGYAFPIEISDISETYFFRSTTCWGWATWSRAWKDFNNDPDYFISTFSKKEKRQFNIDGKYDFWSHLINNKNSKINTWAIFWYATVFKKGGLCLHPTYSLVDNIGHDGSGEHCKNAVGYRVELNDKRITNFDRDVSENIIALKAIKKYYRNLTPRVSDKVKSKINKYFL